MFNSYVKSYISVQCHANAIVPSRRQAGATDKGMGLRIAEKRCVCDATVIPQGSQW